MIDIKNMEQIYGNTAQLQVLVHLINKGNEDYLSGIALATGISHASVGRVLKPLVKTGIVTERLFGKNTRLFKISDSELSLKTQMFMQELDEIMKTGENKSE
jgi:DNA-binding transcriptional ArsR family regulator